MNDETKQHTQSADEGDGVKKLQTERDEYLNGWKRAKADLINYQKDEQKRFEYMVQSMEVGAIKDILPVLDNLSLVCAALEKDGKKEIGLERVKLQIEELLKRKGVSVIPAERGMVFDPRMHEAVAEVAGEQSGAIAEVLEQGYAINDRVIRPARVTIVK